MNETVFHIFSTTVNTRDPGRSQAGIFPAIFYEKNNAGCYALTIDRDVLQFYRFL